VCVCVDGCLFANDKGPGPLSYLSLKEPVLSMQPSHQNGGANEKGNTKGGSLTIMEFIKNVEAANVGLQYYHDTSGNKVFGYQCGFCNIWVESIKALNTHLRTHSQKKFRCRNCTYKSNRKVNLEMHVLIHSNDRKFACSVCFKRFKRKVDVKRHMLTHSGEKPYVCECGNAYRQLSHYRMHRQLHSAKRQLRQRALRGDQSRPTFEQRFGCLVCKKTFVQRANTMHHIFTHLTMYPYQCDVCQKGFNQKTNMKRHQEYCSIPRPHQCPACRCFPESSSSSLSSSSPSSRRERC